MFNFDISTIINNFISSAGKLAYETVFSSFNSFVSDMVGYVFSFEKFVGLDKGILSGIRTVVRNYALLLIVLVFLKKLFDVYVINIDGDDGVSPIEYLKSFVKAGVIILCFTTLYNWTVNVAKDFVDTLLDKIASTPPETSWNLIQAPNGIMMLIFVITFILLIFELLTNSCRLFFLRLAIPLSCVGILNNNSGLFDTFIKSFFQTVITCVAQICLIQLAIPIMVIANDGNFFASVGGIALILYARQLPKDLNQIFMISAGAGAGGRIAQGVGLLTRGIRAVSGK